MKFADAVGPEGENKLSVIGPVTQDEAAAASELLQNGQLQRLRIVVTPPPASSYTYEAYFAPFHAPSVATSELSDEAIALKDRIPK
jgi:hypothetical protein